MSGTHARRRDASISHKKQFGTAASSVSQHVLNALRGEVGMEGAGM